MSDYVINDVASPKQSPFRVRNARSFEQRLLVHNALRAAMVSVTGSAWPSKDEVVSKILYRRGSTDYDLARALSELLDVQIGPGLITRSTVTQLAEDLHHVVIRENEKQHPLVLPTYDQILKQAIKLMREHLLITSDIQVEEFYRISRFEGYNIQKARVDFWQSLFATFDIPQFTDLTYEQFIDQRICDVVTKIQESLFKKGYR